MKITKTGTHWFSFLFEFEYDSDVVEFCRHLKRKYGFKNFNFVKELNKIGWGFNNETIFNKIISKYPNTDIKIDKNELDKTKLKPISKEPVYKLSDKIETKTKLDLYPFQKQGVNFMIKSKGKCLLGDEMGLGKSIQAITYAHINNFKTLIICPASLKLMWQDEIKKFTNRKSMVLYADKIKKQKTNINKYDFVIINYEIVKKVIDNGIDFKGFDLVIADESFYIKNPKSKRSKAVRSFKNIPHRICLTGTPIMNRPAELWAQLNFIEPQMFKNAWSFYMRYADAKRTRFGWDISGASHLDELRSRLNGIMLRRLKENVLKELPPKTETLVRTELPKEMRKKYQDLYNKFEQLIFTDTKAVQMARLTYLKQFLSASKLSEATEIINNVIENGDKIVVFSQYLEPLHSLKKVFGNNAVLFEGSMDEEQKNNAVKSFQEEKPQVFLGSVIASCAGITLTKAEKVLFVDLPWQPAIIAQASDRCHRISQKGNVNIYYMITDNTIDEEIYELIHKKINVISELFNEKKIINTEKQSVLNEFLDKIKKNNHQQS